MRGIKTLFLLTLLTLLLVAGGGVWAGRGGIGLGESRSLAHSGGKSVSSTWVTRKSTKMMRTEAVTTA